MRFIQHPFWSVGFRPFFSLAMLSGIVLPILWVMVYSGRLGMPAGLADSRQWHAHEMFYGFGWAVMGGFLLTSTKNWVKVRGYHGAPLIVLSLLWLGERIALWYAGALPRPIFLIAANAFPAAIAVMLLITLWRNRGTDHYRRDNMFFLVVIPCFVLAKNFMLSADYFTVGVGMTLALFRLALLVMLERTLTDFMRILFQVAIGRRPWLDNSIKVLALLLVAAGFMPEWATVPIYLALAMLLLIRFFTWFPALAFRRLDVAIMYVGYLLLVLQLLVVAADMLHPVAWVGSVATHLFAFGVMGLIIPAMMIRICSGHTGRKVNFLRRDKLVLWIMIMGLAFRVVAPQLAPEYYLRWLDAAAACWAVAFSLLAWRYIPFLMQPRADGREH